MTGSRSPSARRAPSHVLLLRFLLVNLIAGALLAAALAQGWVERAIDADITRLTVVIMALFVIGLALAAWRAVAIDRALEEARRFEPAGAALDYLARVKGRDGHARQIAAGNLRRALQSRIVLVRSLAGSLVFLGLIGTVIGFIIALSGVRPELAADAGTVAAMVSTLIEGMAVALYTTLVGAVGNLWLMANFRLLASGTADLAHDLIELGERHAGA